MHKVAVKTTKTHFHICSLFFSSVGYHAEKHLIFIHLMKMCLIFLPSGLNPVWSGAVESNNTASTPWVSWEHLHIRSTDEQVDRERGLGIRVPDKWEKTDGLKMSSWHSHTKVQEHVSHSDECKGEKVRRTLEGKRTYRSCLLKTSDSQWLPLLFPLLWQNSTEAVVEIDITTGTTYRHTDWITKIFSKHIFRLKNIRPLPLLVPLSLIQWRMSWCTARGRLRCVVQ